MDKNSIPNKTVPAPQVSPEEDATLLAIEALEAREVDTTPVPVVPPTPAPTPLTTPPVIVPEPIIEARPVVIPQPEIPQPPTTTAEEIAKALASTPAPRGFQFFIKQGPPRKPFIILGIFVLIIGIGVGTYFTLH